MARFGWQHKVDDDLTESMAAVREEMEDLALLANDELSLVQLVGFRSLDARDDTYGVLV